ncbi:MAG: TonB C-terminal domain-containing protein [Piscinibacter sp.]|nr:TonB C-terminal domain-containing protein [Piscinibacter sp.]
MTAATLSRDALIPRNPDGLGRGLGLALLVHMLLVVAISFGVSWRSHNPAGIEAELWAAVPQVAAPRAAAPEPAPTPKPRPPEPTPPPPKPQPTPQQQADAQIAIEKARREEEKRKEDERLALLERQKEEQARRQKEQEELERKKKEEQERRKKEEQERARREAEAKRQEEVRAQVREEQMRRLSGLAGATGAPNSTGTALRSAGPSASYAGRIKARILPNIVFTEAIDGNPLATVEVRAGPDGTIIGRRLIKSSGVRAWDEAVLRAIDKTEVLPRDEDGRVPSSFEISFRPRD